MDARKFGNHVTVRTSVRALVGPYMLANVKCHIYYLHFTVSGENEWQ